MNGGAFFNQVILRQNPDKFVFFINYGHSVKTMLHDNLRRLYKRHVRFNAYDFFRHDIFDTNISHILFICSPGIKRKNLLSTTKAAPRVSRMPITFRKTIIQMQAKKLSSQAESRGQTLKQVPK